MKKLVLVLFFALVPFLTIAQQGQKPLAQQQEVKILKASIVIGDLVFVSQTLKTVEIKGNEVEAFLAVDKHITTILQDLTGKNKKAGDTEVIEFPMNIAQNTLVFMDRASLSGQNAVLYKRFVDALVEAAKK
jgi:polysaccharide deacetylase 2 family uncharacterized protein YibQ